MEKSARKDLEEETVYENLRKWEGKEEGKREEGEMEERPWKIGK